MQGRLCEKKSALEDMGTIYRFMHKFIKGAMWSRIVYITAKLEVSKL